MSRITLTQSRAVRNDRRTLVHRELGKWQGAQVTQLSGAAANLSEVLPIFKRRPFRVTTGLSALTADNPKYDVIVRLPNRSDDAEVPVGIVSKRYTLVQHREVIKLSLEGLKANELDPDSVTFEAQITDLGERMELILTLPTKYDHNPGDDNPLGLQVRCINSVDGSTRFMLAVGWLRFICTNGLVAGTTTGQLQRIHNSRLTEDDITGAIQIGLQQADLDRERFSKWNTLDISIDHWRSWVDRTLRDLWGPKAATRAFHIVNTGKDVKLVKPFKLVSPSMRAVEEISTVPGADFGRRTAYNVSQALAWLARQRNDLQERRDWMLQIPRLMQKLLAVRGLN